MTARNVREMQKPRRETTPKSSTVGSVETEVIRQSESAFREFVDRVNHSKDAELERELFIRRFRASL